MTINNMYKAFYMTLALCFAHLSLSAKVLLPSVIADDMVLQQKEEVNLWGKAKANTAVTLTTSWNKKTYKTRSDDQGRWIAKVSTPSAGGPYQIDISDGELLTLKNILIGEVWICSGQSNMEMPLTGFYNQPVSGANDVIAKAKISTPIRIYTSKNEYSKTPQDDVSGSWGQHTAERVAQTSATGYYFAKYLQEVLDVPVGIIVSAWGGSKIEAWISEPYMNSFPEFDLSYLDNDQKSKFPNHYTPCYLYNAKIHPLKNFTAKGMLWYQGESNRDKPEQYLQLQKAFVANMRAAWANPDMPFYFVQIAPFKYSGKDGIEAAKLRESQLWAMQEIPNSGMVVTTDIGSEESIHPPDKEKVGNRLAYWALAKTYNRVGIGYSAPVYQSFQIDGDKIKLAFEKSIPTGFSATGGRIKDFEIAGADKVFHPATAWSADGGIYVKSDQVPNPIAVRYAFKNYIKTDLYDDRGLPLSSFRTDDW